MKAYQRGDIQKAIQYVAEETRKGNPIVLSKIPGLNTLSRGYFKNAMTRSFNFKKHGFDLEAIYSIKEDGRWKMNEFTKNPKDDRLVDLVITAMTYIGRAKRQDREVRKSEFVCDNLKVPSDAELIAEIKKRGYLVYKAL